MHKLHKLSGMAPNSATCEKMRCIPQKNEKPESEIGGCRDRRFALFSRLAAGTTTIGPCCGLMVTNMHLQKMLPNLPSVCKLVRVTNAWILHDHIVVHRAGTA